MISNFVIARLATIREPMDTSCFPFEVSRFAFLVLSRQTGIYQINWITAFVHLPALHQMHIVPSPVFILFETLILYIISCSVHRSVLSRNANLLPPCTIKIQSPSYCFHSRLVPTRLRPDRSVSGLPSVFVPSLLQPRRPIYFCIVYCSIKNRELPFFDLLFSSIEILTLTDSICQSAILGGFSVLKRPIIVLTNVRYS